MPVTTFSTIGDALTDLAAGRMVIVLDDEGRENEGDLVMAAARVTPEAVNFMALHGRGLICAALEASRFEALGIPLMVEDNTALFGTAFGVSVDLKVAGHSGISASDRAMTIQALASPRTQPAELARPGHVFPVRAQEGGVLRRRGHTEAAVDLARLAGLVPAGVMCEILRPDGEMARLPELAGFAARHGLRLITIDALVAHRRQAEAAVRRVGDAALPTPHGPFRVHAYESVDGGAGYAAFTLGELEGADDVLVRVHAQCVTGDVLGARECACGEALQSAQERIAREGRGVLVYALSGKGAESRPHHPLGARERRAADQVVADLGVRSFRLLGDR